MLQHSRVSTGQKEPTDINALADEYLRLLIMVSCKGQIFNASLQTDFDDSIGKINVIPQDVGRVLLIYLIMRFMLYRKRKNDDGE